MSTFGSKRAKSDRDPGARQDNSSNLERRPAIRALHTFIDLHERLAYRAEDVSRDRMRRVLPRLRLHLRRHLPEVESRRAAVEADVARLRDTEVQVGAFCVDIDLRE